MSATTSSAAITAQQRRRAQLIKQRRADAMDIVEFHALLSAGANFIPVPILDSAAVSAVQMRMLRELARYYRQPFEVSSARVLVASLGIGAVHAAASHTTLAQQFKLLVGSVPVIGGFLRFGAWPGLLAGYTFLLGRTCVDHYEAGKGPQDIKDSLWGRLPLNPTVGL